MFHKVSKVVLYDRCNTFARFSEDGLHVSRQAQHFGGVHVHLCGKRSTLGVYCCVLFCRITLLGLRQVETTCNSRGGRGTLRECHFEWQEHHLVQIRRVWNVTLRGRRSIWDTLHFTLYTPHSTLYTFMFHTLHLTLYTPHSTLYIPHSTPLHSTLYALHSTLYTLHFALDTSHSTIPTSYPTHYIPHSTPHCLHAPHSALHPIPHSTVYTDTVTGEMYKAFEGFCFTKVFYVTAYGFVGCSCLLYCID